MPDQEQGHGAVTLWRCLHGYGVHKPGPWEIFRPDMDNWMLSSCTHEVRTFTPSEEAEAAAARAKRLEAELDLPERELNRRLDNQRESIKLFRTRAEQAEAALRKAGEWAEAELERVRGERDEARHKLAEYKLFFGESGRDELALAAAHEAVARAEAAEQTLSAVREWARDYPKTDNPDWAEYIKAQHDVEALLDGGTEK